MKTITIQVPDDCEIQIVRKEEKEKPVIRTYQDLIDNEVKISGYWISYNSKVEEFCRNQVIAPNNKDVAASEKVAKSMLAMAMISQLMPHYGGDITDEKWTYPCCKYVIKRHNRTTIDIDATNGVWDFLAFHTAEQRDEFLKYNEQLVKDYLMIE